MLILFETLIFDIINVILDNIAEKVIKQKVTVENKYISSFVFNPKKFTKYENISLDNARSISVKIAINGKSEATEKNSVNDTNRDSKKTRHI